MDVAVWNVLHDGCITAVEGTVPGELRLTVEIQYLCPHLPTRADHLFVTLDGCERFEYQPYERCATTGVSAVAALELGLLSALEADGYLRVACSDSGVGGELMLRYATARLSTAEGRELSQSDVESAAKRYWTLWKQRHD